MKKLISLIAALVLIIPMAKSKDYTHKWNAKVYYATGHTSAMGDIWVDEDPNSTSVGSTICQPEAIYNSTSSKTKTFYFHAKGKGNYEFWGWSTLASPSNFPTTTNPYSKTQSSSSSGSLPTEIKMYAQFRLKRYTVTVSASPAAGGEVSVSSSTVEHGSSCTLSVTTTNSNYAFDGWYENNTLLSSNTSYTLNNITSNRTIVGKFTQTTSYVTVTSNVATNSTDRGTVSGGVEEEESPADVSLSASAYDGYYFIGWSDVANGSNIVSNENPYEYSATANADYYAVFGQYKTSSISPTGSNSNTNWSSSSVPSGYVDLGLPSGTLWSTKNLGADSEYGLGNLYAWGSKTARSNSSYNQFTYANYDATALTATYTGDIAYDAAKSANASDHTPTQAEWQELLDNCTWVWSSNKFTVSNAGQSITLLACGIGRGEQWNSSSCCYYWSSTYESGSGETKMPYYLLGYDGYEARVTDAAGTGHSGDGYAHHGMPIRPVRAGVAAYTLTIQVKVGNNVVATNTYRCDNGEKVQITVNTPTGYNFVNWADNSSTATTREFTVEADASYTANFTEIASYTVTFQNEDGYVLGTKEVLSGGTATDEGIVKNATYTDGYDYTFSSWSPALGTITENTTYTAQYTKGEARVLELRDKDTDANYDVLANTMVHTGIYREVLDVEEEIPYYLKKITYDRIFRVNEWNTFALPFSWTIEEDSDLDGIVYEFDGASGNATALKVNFTGGVTRIEAGVPYLIYPTSATINSLEFDIEESADNDVLYLTDAIRDNGTGISATKGTGNVTFEATNRRYKLEGEKIVVDEAQTDEMNPTWKDFLFLNNNRLYYPNRKGNLMYAFRAFFHVHATSGVAPRLQIVADGQTIETEEAEELATDEPSQVSKKIENGVLIIERNGVRYNAQGGKL